MLKTEDPGPWCSLRTIADKIQNQRNMTTTEKQLRQRYEESGQRQVFDFVDQIASESDRQALLESLAGIPVEGLAALLESARQAPAPDASTIQPFRGAVARSTDDPSSVNAWRDQGMGAIRSSKVAALVLAGGQGTRLGFAGPKGMFDIGLPSHRTLFQLMAERIRKLSMLATGGAVNSTEESTLIPFYIMTSPLNHEETESFFKDNNYFGLGSKNVFFFRQGMLPCLTTEGKIIMESAGKVAMAPDGNGGIYPSLQSSGALADMTARGVEYLHVYSIDNALVKPADPVFIGYCLSVNADCGNKVVWKAHAHEKVGVVASRNDHPCIVEYSEITQEMAEKTDDTGRLIYGAANICNHFYTLDFIRDTILPNMGNLYHLAHKKIPYYDAATRTTVAPDANNGIKLETFIFDVFPLSQRMAVLDVERREEFAPVKNKAGSPSDSPDTAREMLSKLAQKWIVDAGGKLIGDLDIGMCEIAPLTSYAGEGLEGNAKGKEITCPFSL